MSNIELPPLPYPLDALEGSISAETIRIHYEKHHRGYAEKLNDALRDRPSPPPDLTDLLCTAEGSLFNWAAQTWNHTFYWNSLSPTGGGRPTGEMAAAIDDSFGSYQNFAQQFAQAANAQFGSGWAWLVREPSDRLSILTTSDAETPVSDLQLAPLLTVDVWEHAYYLDYRNERDSYIQRCLDNLLNWSFAEKNLRLVRAGGLPAFLAASA